MITHHFWMPRSQKLNEVQKQPLWSPGGKDFLPRILSEKHYRSIRIRKNSPKTRLLICIYRVLQAARSMLNKTQLKSYIDTTLKTFKNHLNRKMKWLQEDKNTLVSKSSTPTKVLRNATLQKRKYQCIQIHFSMKIGTYEQGRTA